MSTLQGLSLFPFQEEDVQRVLDRKSVLIGNEMGTGKTFEALALDLRRRAASQVPDKKTLVVAPLSVVPVWKSIFSEYTDFRVATIDPKNRADFLRRLAAKDADIYIVHWDVLRIIKEELRGQYWFHIIADEVHRAKNRKAQQTRALKYLRAIFKTGLSGTPATNKPYDLWSVLDWLYPKPFGLAYWAFFERYCISEVTYPQGYRVFKGVKNTDELQEKMAGFYVRRKKQDVLKDLPDKYYTTIWVDLLPIQRKAYEEMRKEMVAWLNQQPEERPLVAPVVIAQLIRLQQFAVAYVALPSYQDGNQTQVATSTTDGSMRALLTEPSSKLDALMQILEDNEDEQFVVFSQFKQLINLAATRLERAGISFVRITGDIAASDRGRAVEDFQSGRARIFLGTIAAGGEGITLHSASTVIFLDRDWSPAKNAQAEDRLHRIGQKNAVQVIDIAATKTIDVRKRGQLEMKKKWLSEILDP